HRLEGEYRVLPGRKVQVEGWFETGDSPRGGRVRVYRADGSPLFAEPGELDDKGVWVFAYEKPERLRVVISAGQGHRKELVISEAELANPGAPGAKGADRPPAERAADLPVKELLLGGTVRLALGAFVLSLRNARRLAELRGRAPDPASGGRQPPESGPPGRPAQGADAPRSPREEGIREGRR